MSALTIATPPSYSSSMYTASNLGRSDLLCPRVWISLSLSPSSVPTRYVLSGLALASFPLSAFGAPFASSCHRSLLPPASYKDAGGNLFILASRNGMPRSFKEAASARLPTRRCSARNTTESALAIFHSHLLALILSRSLILRHLGLPIQTRLSGQVFTVNVIS